MLLEQTERPAICVQRRFPIADGRELVTPRGFDTSAKGNIARPPYDLGDGLDRRETGAIHSRIAIQAGAMT